MAANKRAKGAGRPENPVPHHTLGGRIRVARKAAGLSLIELGQRTGFSHVTISDTERGKTKPEKHTLIALARELKSDFGETWLREHIKEETEVKIPITARVAAGDAVEFLEDADEITVDSSMIKKRGRHFALRVSGESMEGAHVLSGDIVIVRAVPRTYEPSRNELVIADIRDEGITLKRWKRVKDEVLLIPSTEGYKEIRRPADRVKPVAVVVGVVRIIT